MIFRSSIGIKRKFGDGYGSERVPASCEEGVMVSDLPDDYPDDSLAGAAISGVGAFDLW